MKIGEQTSNSVNRRSRKHKLKNYARRSKPLAPISTVNTEVPAINTIDTVIVEGPTTHMYKASDDQNTEVKPHPAIISTQCAQNSSSPEKYTVPVHDNQGIVIRLEIFNDKLNTSKETTGSPREVQARSRSEPTIVVKDQTVKSPNDHLTDLHGSSHTETSLQPKGKLDRQLPEQGVENKKTEVHFQSGNLREDFSKPQKLQPSNPCQRWPEVLKTQNDRLLQTLSSNVKPLSLERYVVVPPTS